MLSRLWESRFKIITLSFCVFLALFIIALLACVVTHTTIQDLVSSLASKEIQFAIRLSIFTSVITLAIVLVLLKMESACACEIQFALNESRQPLVSHHLRALKRAGWLASEKWKKWTFYSLIPEKKDAMMSLIHGYAT